MAETALRAFFVDKDDKVRRIPWARFSRLYYPEQAEPLDGYQNEWARFAELFLALGK